MLLPLFLFAILSVLIGEAAVADDAIGLRVPEGFKVSLFADDDLAHDIHSLTIDSRGRVVVSGPGYVRFLVDDDEDGTADRAKEFVDAPRSGAQGMYWHGRDLICSGDDGLQIYRDDDRDDKADGPPEVFLRILAGGEHHAHSIQRGPDGWWYIIAGNYAGVTGAYGTLPSSPIKEPQSGVVMRLRPDLFGGEIIADGFRNAYDFAFTRSGDMFTFDSDGERDVTLPWYRPTRAFHVLPMSHAGWISRSWKRRDEYFDMPPVVGSFGRGSPTGVVTYKHTQFPERYRGAVFLLDWTYGKIFALPLTPNGATWKTEPIEFMSGVGTFGFAPTDAEVGPDGSLYVSVGGRGTRGGVYRITWGDAEAVSTPTYAESDSERLEQVLAAPQPLASWSRSRWVRTAQALNREVFVTAALDAKRTPEARMRAIEILTELFEGIDNETATALGQAKSPLVRARAAWAVGRTNPEIPSVETLLPYLSDSSPFVVRCALEAFQGATEACDRQPILEPLAKALGHSDRFVRLTAAQIVSRLPKEKLSEIAKLTRTSAPGTIALGGSLVLRNLQVRANVSRMAMAVLDSRHPKALKLESARILQMSLSDLGPTEDRVPAQEAYAPRVKLDDAERELNPIRTQLAGIFPTGDDELDYEIARALAMLAPLNSDLIDPLLAKVTAESDPVSDIHYLLVLSRIAVDRNHEQTVATAQALLGLDEKIARRNLIQDANWEARVSELYQALVQLDSVLPIVISQQPEFGRPPHVAWLSELPPEHLQAAVEKFVARIEADGDYSWSNNVIFVLGESTEPAHREIVRAQADNLAVQSAVLVVLGAKPEEQDRARFVTGLESPDLGVLEACITALGKLPPTEDAAEHMQLMRTARRLNEDQKEFRLREQVVRILEQGTGEEFDFVYGEDGHRPQPDAIGRLTEFLQEKHPKLAAEALGSDEAELKKLAEMMADVDWDAGDAERGLAVFTRQSCAQCHGGQRALGPDLDGVTSRFSRDDLFTAIAAPNRDVSPRYQTTLVQTEAGKVYSGLIIYQSVDGMLLRDSTNKTYRIEAADIEETRRISTSLMPAGLLRELPASDLADLYAYLQTLKKP